MRTHGLRSPSSSNAPPRRSAGGRACARRRRRRPSSYGMAPGPDPCRVAKTPGRARRFGEAPGVVGRALRRGIIDLIVRTSPATLRLRRPARQHRAAPRRRSSSPSATLPLVDAVAGPPRRAATSLTETLGEYFHTFRNVDLLVEGFQTIAPAQLALLRAFRGPRAALRAPRGAGPAAARRAAHRRAVLAAAPRPCCSGARRPSTGRHGDAYDDALADDRRGAPRAAAPVQPAAFLERDALLRNLVEQARRAAGARGRLPRVSIGEVLLLGYRRVRGAPRRARLGDGAGRRAHRSGGRRRALRLPRQASACRR